MNVAAKSGKFYYISAFDFYHRRAENLSF